MLSVFVLNLGLLFLSFEILFGNNVYDSIVNAINSNAKTIN